MTEDRVELFRADLLAGPAALLRLVAAREASDGPVGVVGGLDERPLRFAGLGSSRFAALVAAAELRALGRQVEVDWASAVLPADRDAVLYAISSSGRTPEVVDAAARQVRAGGVAIAVTNAVGSPLAAAATATLPLLAGTERSGIACTTFRATVLALLLWTGAIDPGTARRQVEQLRASMTESGREVDVAVDVLDRAETVDVIGDGQSIGALEQAALMLREGPRLRAAAWDAGDWLHTAVYTALPGHRAILFPGTPYDAEIAATIRRRGGEVVVLDAATAGRPLTAAIVAVAAVELAAAGLWARAGAQPARMS